MTGETNAEEWHGGSFGGGGLLTCMMMSAVVLELGELVFRLQNP
jgi:hypothetical protein